MSTPLGFEAFLGVDIPYFRGLVPRGAYRFSKFLVGRLIEQER